VGSQEIEARGVAPVVRACETRPCCWIPVRLPLTPARDPAHASTGLTSLVPLDAQDEFRVDSFFDIFVEPRLDTPTPLSTTRGPIHVGLLSPVPEPASLAMLAGGLLLRAAWRRRQVASS
jgi:hypothetical protein